MTLEPVVLLNPMEGDHTYVAAPAAVSIPVEPVHIVMLGTLTVGIGLTVIVTVVEPVQLPAEPDRL